MLAAAYKTKKVAKEFIGQSPRFIETSLFGNEYNGDGVYTVVGPSPLERKWFGNITIENGIIAKVS